jgi:hypothetical protein
MAKPTKLKSVPRLSDEPMTWITRAVLQLVTSSGDRTFMGVLSVLPNGRVLVEALEIAKQDPKANRKDPVSATEKVHSSHAHEVIGMFDTIPEAMKEAETRALLWQLDKAKEKCACGPIVKVAKSKRAAYASYTYRSNVEDESG